MEKFWRITVHVPILGSPERAITTRLDVQESKELAAVLEAIKRVPEIGRVGKYDGVYELSIGFEGYLPREGAAPHYGSIGEHSRICSVAITTYVRRATDHNILNQMVDAIRRFHPWEHPIVEVTECLLYIPEQGDIGGPARGN